MQLTKEELQDLATKTTLNQQELDRYIEKCSGQHADDKRILEELKSIRKSMSSKGVFTSDITIKLIAAMIKHEFANDVVVINNIVTNEVVSSMLSSALLLMLLKHKAVGMEALIKIALHNNADMRVLDTLVLYSIENVEQLHKEILKSKLAVQLKEGSLWKIAKFAKELEVLKKVLECDNGLAESILEAIKKSSLYKANKINKLELDAAIENAKNNKIIADLRKELATERDGKGQAVNAVTAKDVDIAKLQGALVEAAKQHQEALKVEVDKVKQDAEQTHQVALDEAEKLHQAEIVNIKEAAEQTSNVALDNAARQHQKALATEKAAKEKALSEVIAKDTETTELQKALATEKAAKEKALMELGINVEEEVVFSPLYQKQGVLYQYKGLDQSKVEADKDKEMESMLFVDRDQFLLGAEAEIEGLLTEDRDQFLHEADAEIESMLIDGNQRIANPMRNPSFKCR